MAGRGTDLMSKRGEGRDRCRMPGRDAKCRRVREPSSGFRINGPGIRQHLGTSPSPLYPLSCNLHPRSVPHHFPEAPITWRCRLLPAGPAFAAPDRGHTCGSSAKSRVTTIHPLTIRGTSSRAPPSTRLVVQGGLTTGLLHALVAMDLPGPGTVFLSQNWKFTAPVFIDDTITAEVEVLSVRSSEARYAGFRDSCCSPRTVRQCSKVKRGVYRFQPA